MLHARAFALPCNAIMGGVLHLHPVQCDFQTRRSIEPLIRSVGGGASVEARSIGAGGDFRSLTAAARALRSMGNSTWPIVQAWGPVELIAATVAGCRRIIFSPQAPTPRKWARWTGVILRRWPIEIVCPTKSLCDLFIDNGVPAGRCRVIYPAVSVDRVRPMPNIRAELGFTDSDIVLLAPGESSGDADHRGALWSAAILNVLDERFRLLTWGRGPAGDALRKFAKCLRQEQMLVQAERRLGHTIEFESLVCAADAAIIAAPGIVQTLPIQVCMAAGLPVVASASATLGEILDDEVTALMNIRSTPRTLAQRVLDLLHDPDLRRNIVRAARDAAQSRVYEIQFIAEWKGLYEWLAADGLVAAGRESGMVLGKLGT
jgi:glycosyltransferase involved in cell wall biosynthesis